MFNGNSRLEKIGWLLLGQGLSLFLAFDWIRDFKFAVSGYETKYTLITLGSCMISGLYLRQTRLQNNGEFQALGKVKYFVCFTVLHVWLYCLHMANIFFITTVPRNFYYEFYKVACMATTTFAAGYAVCHIVSSTSILLRLFRLFLYGYGSFMVLWIDTTLQISRFFADQELRSVMTILVLLALNVVMALAVREVGSVLRARYKTSRLE